MVIEVATIAVDNTTTARIASSSVTP